MGDPYAGILTPAQSLWVQVGTDAVAIAVSLAAVFVIFRGARMLLGFISGDDVLADGGSYESGAAVEGVDFDSMPEVSATGAPGFDITRADPYEGCDQDFLDEMSERYRE